MKDYCSLFPETFRGVDISPACKLHDNLCGQAGTWCFFKTVVPFYKKLRECGLSRGWSVVITTGGSILCLVKWPYLLYKKLKYN